MILLIDCDGTTARAIAGFFRYYGIPTERLGAKEACEFSKGSYTCAILCGADHSDRDGFIAKVHTALGECPTFIIADRFSSAELSDGTYGRFVLADGSLPFRINDSLQKSGRRSLFYYEREGVCLDCGGTLSVKGKASIRLTKTEAMLMRLLIDTYPTPICAERAVGCVYPDEKRPEPSVIRTHVCAVNKRVEGLVGLPLIRSVPHEGYILAV